MYEEYFSSVRKHIEQEHKTWVESFFKIITFSNTGGIALAATLMGNTSYRKEMWLQLTLTFFVLGLVMNILAIAHEVKSAKRRLARWDAGIAEYREKGSRADAVYRNYAAASKTNQVDLLIGIAATVFFVAGCLAAFPIIWNPPK